MKNLKFLLLVYSTQKTAQQGSRGRCWAAIRLSRHPELSGHAVQGKVDELDIRGQHGRRFVLLHYTHRAQREPYPICTNRKGNVRHQCGGGWTGPTLFLGGSFREGGCRCRDESAECWSALQPFRILPHLCYCCQMNWWVVVQRLQMGVSIWDALHLHSMDRWALSGAGVRDPCRARDNVALLRRSSAGWMPARTGRLSAGVGCRHPVTIRKASLMAGLIRRAWALRHQAVLLLRVECPMARVAIRNVVAPAPQPEPGSRFRSGTRDVSFLRSDSRYRRHASDLSTITPR